VNYLRRAACTLVRHPNDGKILSVSRGYDISDWGLPGGMAQPGETPSQTAARELHEETGITPDTSAEFVPVYNGMSHYHFTTIFAINGMIFLPRDKFRSVPFEGYVEWLNPEELTRPSCTFGVIQKEIFITLGIM